MLEFIVLGQIPGTHFQVTFMGSMLIGCGFLLFILTASWLNRPKHTQETQRTQTEQLTFDLISL